MPYEIKPVYRQLRRSFVAYWSDFLRTVVIPRLWEMSYHLSETIRVLRMILRSLLDERLKSGGCESLQQASSCLVEHVYIQACWILLTSQ